MPETDRDTPVPAASAPGLANPFELAAQQRVRFLRFVRGGFFVLITTVAALLTIQAQQAAGEGGGGGADQAFAQQWYTPVAVAVFLFCVALLIDLFTPNKKLSTISAVFFGVLAGMLATAALSAVIDVLVAAWAPVPDPNVIAAPLNMVKVMLGMALCYLGVSSVLQTQDDFRLVIPYVEFARQIRGAKPNILDTSALIDARIADICASGLIQSPVVVPRFVIAELQLLADSSDRLKRARGRRGLDVVTRLQRLGTVDVSIDDSRVGAISVDQMLVELATQLSARIITTDLALTRIAQIHGVQALNLHDVANAFRPAVIPGEHLSLRLVKPGEQPGQGVGYLEDGTMVVADAGAAHVGAQVELLVTGSMQTTAGRLVFARVVDAQASTPVATELAAHAEPTDSGVAPAAPVADTHAEADDGPDAPAQRSAEPAIAQTPASTPPASPRRSPLPPVKPSSRRDPSGRNPRR